MGHLSVAAAWAEAVVGHLSMDYSAAAAVGQQTELSVAAAAEPGGTEASAALLGGAVQA